MTHFDQMKEFFLQHREKLVAYRVIDSTVRTQEMHLPEYVCENILNNPNVKDFFVIEFPCNSNTSLIEIDSLDSFVFDLYFVDYGDKITITDAQRTVDCGVEAYEGNGVIFTQKAVTEHYLAKNGLQFDG